jgi:hypothetical protein
MATTTWQTSTGWDEPPVYSASSNVTTTAASPLATTMRGSGNWAVADMKRDWKVIFPFQK